MDITTYINRWSFGHYTFQHLLHFMLTLRDISVGIQCFLYLCTARPTYQRMTFKDGSPISNGTSIGPFDEGSTVDLKCESGGGKPVAKVSWWNGTEELPGIETHP